MATSTSRTRHCQWCGAPLPDGAHFCGQCGEDARLPQTQEPPRTTKLGAGTAVGLMLAIEAIVVFGTYVFASSMDSNFVERRSDWWPILGLSYFISVVVGFWLSCIIRNKNRNADPVSIESPSETPKQRTGFLQAVWGWVSTVALGVAAMYYNAVEITGGLMGSLIATSVLFGLLVGVMWGDAL